MGLLRNEFQATSLFIPLVSRGYDDYYDYEPFCGFIRQNSFRIPSNHAMLTVSKICLNNHQMLLY